MTDFVTAHRQALLPLRAQADLRNAWLRTRLDTLLPELMARKGFDCWIVAEEDISASIYSHPLGYHGHAAGPTIGLWDQQGGVPGRGDYEVFDETCYSIELNARSPVPEWDGQEVRIALEEDALLWDGTPRWLDGRQTELHLVG